MTLNMEPHFTLNDEAFELQFNSGVMPPELFTHEAHSRLAWIHLKKYGVEQAVKNVCTQLQHYTALLGASDKYHETLTIAAVRAVHHFMLKTECDDFQGFINDNPRLKYNFKDLIFQHYATDILISETARKTYLEPELLPFD